MRAKKLLKSEVAIIEVAAAAATSAAVSAKAEGAAALEAELPWLEEAPVEEEEEELWEQPPWKRRKVRSSSGIESHLHSSVLKLVS